MAGQGNRRKKPAKKTKPKDKKMVIKKELKDGVPSYSEGFKKKKKKKTKMAKGY